MPNPRLSVSSSEDSMASARRRYQNTANYIAAQAELSTNPESQSNEVQAEDQGLGLADEDIGNVNTIDAGSDKAIQAGLSTDLHDAKTTTIQVDDEKLGLAGENIDDTKLHPKRTRSELASELTSLHQDIKAISAEVSNLRLTGFSFNHAFNNNTTICSSPDGLELEQIDVRADFDKERKKHEGIDEKIRLIDEKLENFRVGRDGSAHSDASSGLRIELRRLRLEDEALDKMVQEDTLTTIDNVDQGWPMKWNVQEHKAQLNTIRQLEDNIRNSQSTIADFDEQIRGLRSEIQMERYKILEIQRHIVEERSPEQAGVKTHESIIARMQEDIQVDRLVVKSLEEHLSRLQLRLLIARHSVQKTERLIDKAWEGVIQKNWRIIGSFAATNIRKQSEGVHRDVEVEQNPKVEHNPEVEQESKMTWDPRETKNNLSAECTIGSYKSVQHKGG